MYFSVASMVLGFATAYDQSVKLKDRQAGLLFAAPLLYFLFGTVGIFLTVAFYIFFEVPILPGEEPDDEEPDDEEPEQR